MDTTLHAPARTEFSHGYASPKRFYGNRHRGGRADRSGTQHLWFPRTTTAVIWITWAMLIHRRASDQGQDERGQPDLGPALVGELPCWGGLVLGFDVRPDGICREDEAGAGRESRSPLQVLRIATLSHL